MTGGQLVWIDQESEQTDLYGWRQLVWETTGLRAELHSLEDLAALYFCGLFGASFHQRVSSERRKMTVMTPVRYALPTGVKAFVYKSAYHYTPTPPQWPTMLSQE